MPGAWEIIEERRNRILVAVITPPDLKVTLAWARHFNALALPPGSQTMQARGFNYDANRNLCLKGMLQGGFGWLMWVDTDVHVPRDAVMRLLASGRDLIGGVYFRKEPPYLSVASVAQFDASGIFVHGKLPEHQPGDVVPVDFLGSGCTLISRRCVEDMFARFPRPYQWALDVAPVMDHEGKPLPGYSEDFIFSVRAREIGYQPYLHTGVVCQHETLAAVGPRGLELIRE